MSDYRFESQTVADKLGQIIDASIGYVNKKQQKDKYFRGTTGNVSSTTADVYLFNSSTPIPNVKIASGIRHLFNNEDVYLVAIGGRLDNSIIDKRVIDYDLVYEDEIDNFLTIDDFSIITHTWTCTQPTYATMVEANNYYKLYTASKKTNYLISQSSYTFQATVSNLDLTKFHDLDASTTDDIIFFSFFMGYGVEYIDYVELRFYKNSNYYNFILQDESISAGWNRIKQTKSTFTNNGMSGWTGINKITVTIAYTQSVPLDSFVNFAYLGMANLHAGSVVAGLVTDMTTAKSDIDAVEADIDVIQEDITDLQGDIGDLQTQITNLPVNLSGTSNQITVTGAIKSELGATLSFPYDFKIYENVLKYNVLFSSYTWNTALSVFELGAGASFSIPKISAESNEFILANNFYKNGAGNMANIFAGSGSGLVLKRDAIDFIVTDTASSFYDSSYLRIRQVYDASAPLAKVQIAGNEVVFQNNITLRTSVLNWYYDICKVIQVGDTGALFAYIETYKNINLSQNLLYDNTSHDYRRIEATPASLYQQKLGTHIFYVAGTGSIGSAISFTQAFKIDNDGNFYLGTRKLTVSATEPSTPTTGDLWLDVS